MRPAARTLIVAFTALVSLALTVLAWRAALEQAEREDRLRFDSRVEEIAAALRARMLEYEQVLGGAVALFAVSRTVDRRDWATYFELLDLRSRYPGIQAIAYARGERSAGGWQFPVTYVAPADARNTRALGLDMYADPVRRVAMDRARDAAEPVLSGPLRLLQDGADTGPRSALIMYLPVFRTGASPSTLEARRTELMGFVYGAFRVRELVERTIGTPPGIRLRLHDVTDLAAPVVLIEQEADFGAAERHERAATLVVRGRTWRLEAAAPAGVGAEAPGDRPRLVLVSGIAISILFTILVWSLLNTATQARGLARRVTAASEELERFRAAIDGHQDTMLVIDPERMRIVYANEGACRNLGYRREELVGRSPALVFEDRNAEQLRGEYRRLQQHGGDAEVYRALHRRKDGSVFPVEISRALVKGTDARFVVGVARDITARLAAEQALSGSEQRLALALDSSGLALFDWDLRTGMVHMGAQWAEVIGGAPEPSVTPIQKLEQRVHPDDLPALREQLRRLLKGEIERYRVEHRVRNARGDWIWIESVAEVSERDADGRALRVTGTNGDITARKAIAEMKNVFVAAVSHELRTPLTGVIASLDLLREGAAGELAPLARDFVERAHANGERLAALINDVLDLERAESGRLQLQLERLDAAEVLQEAAGLDASYAAQIRRA